MRKLWTEPSVTFSGDYHRVTGAGLAPLPVQRPIPVWFGASSSRAFRRAGRLGDGWFPMYRDATQDAVAEARALGLKVGAWTVDDPADMRALTGLDALCTDRPDLLAAVLAET